MMGQTKRTEVIVNQMKRMQVVNQKMILEEDQMRRAWQKL